MNNLCPYCEAEMVLPYDGRDDCLYVGEYPEIFDKNKGIPLSGEAGEILHYELGRLGVSLWDGSTANLWLHDKNKDERCFQLGIQTLTRAMAGRKVLLMGAEACKYFLNESVTDVSGLVVQSPLFPKSVQWVMVSVAPGIALHQPHGELRLSVTKFVSLCKQS